MVPGSPTLRARNALADTGRKREGIGAGRGVTLDAFSSGNFKRIGAHIAWNTRCIETHPICITDVASGALATHPTTPIIAALFAVTARRAVITGRAVVLAAISVVHAVAVAPAARPSAPL